MLKQVLNKKGLSNREAEVTGLVSQGFSNREIATKLFIIENTVKFHLTNVYKKMQVRSRAQLIVWCMPHLNLQGSSRNQEINKDSSASANAQKETPSIEWLQTECVRGEEK